MTQGNYRVLRAVSYPDYPRSLLAIDVEVTATDDGAWETTIVLNGTYDGPTDVVANDDYHLTWQVDGPKLLESGVASLELASGGRVRQQWSSIITPGGRPGDMPRGFAAFPSQGEAITATISPFKIDDNRMSYAWEGTVKPLDGKAG